MNTFAARLTPELSMSDRFVVVGEALRAMEDYNRHTSRFLRIQNAELQNMITMLTQTVIAVGSSSETSVAGLQGIEKALEEARMVEDVRVVKAQLGECLQSVRGEAQRQKEEGKAALESIQQELAQSQQRLGGFSVGSNLDSGYRPSRKTEAEKALHEAASLPGTLFVAARRGQPPGGSQRALWIAIGDQALAIAAEHFRSALHADDKLYRWNGPALLAVMSRKAAAGRSATKSGASLKKAGENFRDWFALGLASRSRSAGRYFRLPVPWTRSCARSSYSPPPKFRMTDCDSVSIKTFDPRQRCRQRIE